MCQPRARRARHQGHACPPSPERVAGEHPARLLVDGNLSGYGNLSLFNRQFLKQKGLSPREFRKQHGLVVRAA